MRLIDADALKTRKSINSANFNTIETIQEWIDNAPTIDLVTCRECMHWHEGEWYNTCDKHIGHGFEDDYFCKYGERRSDETD